MTFPASDGSSVSLAIQQRPELMLGPNPFIEALPPPIKFTALPAALKRAPLANVAWQGMDAALREPFLEVSSQHFVSTAALLEPASGVQILLRRALLMRNPLNADERKRMNRLGLVDAKPGLKSLPRLEGAGMLLSGMTGTGKTALLARMLELIVPEQIIDFGKSEACGWYRLRQCVYLRVDHPSNGTRGALLKRILQELDNALGTDYFSEHKKSANLDTLLVVVCKLLSLHRVALISIDEKQQSTFGDSPWRLEFVLFYLTLMNLGISVILAGNPLAFEHLRVFSQVVRRFSIGGIYDMLPASSSSENWWSRDFVPFARKFSVIDKWAVEPERQAALEFEHSGGLPGLFVPYNVEVQRSALRRGGTTAVVTEKDFAAAANSPRFIEVKKIALSIQGSGAGEINEFLDVPLLPVAGAGSRDSSSSKTLPVLPSDRAVAVVKRLLATYKAAQTRKTNALIQQLSVLKSLDPDDVRGLGITEDLLSELERTTTSMPKRAPGKKSVPRPKDGGKDDAA